MNLIPRLRALCGSPRDGALLRFSLGNALLAAGETAEAVRELKQAIAFDANYSAAWKLLGRALVEAGDLAQARQVWSDGIAAAARAGDVQARKEMQVFLKRLDHSAGAPRLEQQSDGAAAHGSQSGGAASSAPQSGRAAPPDPQSGDDASSD